MDKQTDTFKDTMLTIKDFQMIFNCGNRQAYGLLCVPGFPVMKLGGKYLISATALDSWILNNTGKTIIK